MYVTRHRHYSLLESYARSMSRELSLFRTVPFATPSLKRFLKTIWTSLRYSVVLYTESTVTWSLCDSIQGSTCRLLYIGMGFSESGIGERGVLGISNAWDYSHEIIDYALPTLGPFNSVVFLAILVQEEPTLENSCR